MCRPPLCRLPVEAGWLPAPPGPHHGLPEPHSAGESIFPSDWDHRPGPDSLGHVWGHGAIPEPAAMACGCPALVTGPGWGPSPTLGSQAQAGALGRERGGGVPRRTLSTVGKEGMGFGLAQASQDRDVSCHIPTSHFPGLCEVPTVCFHLCSPQSLILERCFLILGDLMIYLRKQIVSPHFHPVFRGWLMA